ncbi:MAG: helix-turn-helix domain-containing protein, partial [Terracidiphilus sp.]
LQPACRAVALRRIHDGLPLRETAGVVGLGCRAAGAAAAGLGPHASNGKPEIRFTMALTHEEIANMAGTSRETVTRLLNQFRRDQWITIKGTSLTIVKPEQLEKLTA